MLCLQSAVKICRKQEVRGMEEIISQNETKITDENAVQGGVGTYGVSHSKAKEDAHTLLSACAISL